MAPADIEQHIYDKKHVPAPTDNQPKHGKFAHSIARRASASRQPHAGKFNMSKPKNYIEKHVEIKEFNGCSFVSHGADKQFDRQSKTLDVRCK